MGCETYSGLKGPATPREQAENCPKWSRNVALSPPRWPRKEKGLDVVEGSVTHSGQTGISMRGINSKSVGNARNYNKNESKRFKTDNEVCGRYLG